MQQLITQISATKLSHSIPPLFFVASSIGCAIARLYVPLCLLRHYWHLLLERCFPTRPRGVEIDYTGKEKAGIHTDEGQEEEVVKRWIAQGKVRRSSISWWNTFIKWVLNGTVGDLWFVALQYWLDGFLRGRSFSDMRVAARSVRWIISAPHVCSAPALPYLI